MARIARIGLYRQQFNGQATRIEWVSIERALAIVKLKRIKIEIRIINVKIMKLISRRPSLVEPAAGADPAAQLTLPENSY